jgi:hypothetical protein
MTTNQSRAVVQWNAEKYPPLGRCLYGTGSEHEGDLSDEHIIPFALLPKGGDWFLPKASCAACAEITSKFEGSVCRGMFGTLRQQIGLKSRRKKSKTTTVRYNYPDGSLVDKEIGVADLPYVCMGFRWRVPGILSGVPPAINVRDELVMRYNKAALDKHATTTQAVRLGRVGPLQFAQMLAKIAHAWAVAEYGFDSFEPLLPPLILGHIKEAPYLVGGDFREPQLPEQSGVLHDLARVDCRLNDGPSYFGVAIRLFAALGVPRYHIIVGRRLKEAPPSRKCGETKAVQLPIAPR